MFDTPDEKKAETDAILAAGAFIMGRNMFGPIRGEWTEDWRGWWGDDPPFHGPVFVLTHHPRETVTMQGGHHVHVRPRRHRVGAGAGEGRGRRPQRGDRGWRDHDQPVPAGGPHRRAAHSHSPAHARRRRTALRGYAGHELELVSARAASLATHITYRLRRWAA
jgi:hypothetical protein